MIDHASGDRARRDAWAGVGFALLAYGSWGTVPLFWRRLSSVHPIDVVAHRVVWSLVFVALLLVTTGRFGEVRRALRHPATRWTLMSTGALIAVNWGLFIYAVMAGKLVYASLGYFLNPLLNVALGVTLLGEPLRPLTKVAVVLSALALGVLVVGGGSSDWGGLALALVLATTFAAYGFLRKRAPVESLVGLFSESLALGPFALGWLIHRELAGEGVVSTGGPIALCLLAGPITALPLGWFGAAARRLPLSRLGFFQYVSPSLQLAIAVGIGGEPLGLVRLVGFGIIWTALVLASVDAVWGARRRIAPDAREARSTGAPALD